MRNSALVVVDMLYDFIDGSLACENADNAVTETLKYINSQTKGQGGDEHDILDTFPILFIRDHHPADHCSFKSCHALPGRFQFFHTTYS
jgi:nicotinamidase-related amidase